MIRLRTNLRGSVGWWLLCLWLTAAAESAEQAEVTRPVSERFAAASNREIPDFQRHVIPLLGRLGCNGRACHGSFQGRGGFRLSLFGYDFAADHAALSGPASAEAADRIDRDAPESSLILQKPSLQLDHEGGQRFEPGGWEHQLLQRWIEAGAAGSEQPAELARLEIDPQEIVFADDDRQRRLRVTAVWEDGSSEEVTPLCRFRTNDDSVATIDNSGVIRSVGAGDTHVIAFYDNGVAALPVLRPRSAGKCTSQVAPSATPIDTFIEAKLQKLGVVPSAICSDAEFLRRVSIDLTGTLPAPTEVEQFLADNTPEKRRLKVDELLERLTYAAWWANKLCDFTGCNPNQQAELGQETSVQWYGWIYQRIVENVPYDQLVRRIMLAEGRSADQSYDEYAAAMSGYYTDPNTFAQRETMPHYWTRRSMEKAQDKALAVAHSFLGVRLQCAQCHKHPFAPWTQHDFEQFSRFFAGVRYGVPAVIEERYRELAEEVGLQVRGDAGAAVRKELLHRAQQGRLIPWRELYVEDRDHAETLSLLRSRLVTLPASDDPRVSIVEWMTEPTNPWFARAFVNRVWAAYFSVGIIEPPDDLNPANPPSHPQLLKWLSDGLVSNGYDMKWLHREILNSDVYQRRWQPNETNRDDRRNFSRAIPRRIAAEVVYDGVKQAVAATDEALKVRNDLTRRASGHLSMRLAGTYAMHVFGKPERAVNCDCERVNQPTLLQAVFLQNDPLIDQRLGESGWLRELREREPFSHGESKDVVRAAWLRTLSRPPNADELRRGVEHLEAADSIADGTRDLLWALINTKEFSLY